MDRALSAIRWLRDKISAFFNHLCFSREKHAKMRFYGEWSDGKKMEILQKSLEKLLKVKIRKHDDRETKPLMDTDTVIDVLAYIMETRNEENLQNLEKDTAASIILLLLSERRNMPEITLKRSYIIVIYNDEMETRFSKDSSSRETWEKALRNSKH